jgi:hypothetical protein
MQIVRVLTIGALALTASIDVASAQSAQLPPGRIYSFHSPAKGGCPSLNWHIVIGANETLDGMIGWDDMKAVAHATGTVNPTARTFTMQAQEAGGQGRTVTIDGRVRTDGWMTANIHGPNISCTGIDVPWGVPPPTN